MSLKSHSNAIFFFDGFKNELRHLCPKKAAWCWRHPCASQTWQFSRLRGGWQWQTHLETGFCPHHQALAWLAPSMWFGIVWKQARFRGHISASGKEMRHRCGIFWLGWLMDVGRYEGVAPSVWAFAAWFWRMSGSWAIYVPKNDLFFAIFCAGFPPYFFLNIKLPFWDIDGATPTHSPKSGCNISLYIYLQIITIGILLGLFWAMFDNLGSLWWAKLGGPWSGQF